ncbi:hypothetical protein [uncultured Limosilactobacillus sp.]|uniref:hypothetical protein n=1 Tax=uncultured Limosilactobacillus sp. TaxID=2837629 RepID=UPI0025DFC7B6|nr:hypothetical protein [uncultured Limosilactobacillus sp.]
MEQQKQIMNEQLPMDEINYEPKSQPIHRLWLMPKYLYKLVERLTPKFVRKAEWDPFFLWIIILFWVSLYAVVKLLADLLIMKAGIPSNMAKLVVDWSSTFFAAYLFLILYGKLSLNLSWSDYELPVDSYQEIDFDDYNFRLKDGRVINLNDDGHGNRNYQRESNRLFWNEKSAKKTAKLFVRYSKYYDDYADPKYVVLFTFMFPKPKWETAEQVV